MSINNHPAVILSQQLLQKPSVTPDDCGCQDIIADTLKAHDFRANFLYFGDKNAPKNSADAQVKNLWLRRGSCAPLFCFLGHTDVVPTGDEALWQHPPFSATIDGDYLYARGAADMKTAIACFTVAVKNFVQKHPNHKGSIAILLTSDEEGIARHGTQKVVQYLSEHDEKIDYCLVGEPSSTSTLGDVIKNGRRGSLSANLTVTGKQGHVAYPHLALNPIHLAAPAINKLCAHKWDEGDAYFPPTTMQISNIQAGTGANNVIAEKLFAQFNFRFSTQLSPEQIKQTTHQIFDEFLTQSNDVPNTQGSYHIDWHLSGLPFLTEAGAFTNACADAIEQVVGIKTALSTTGGTSDGRFVAPTGASVVELGVINQTIHQINERVLVDDLVKLTNIYEKILENMLT